MTLDTLYKSYMYKSLYKDLSKFVAKNVKNMDFDREYWLRRMGLTSYRPTKAAFGGMSLFLLGAVAGGVAGLFLTPRTGTEMRTTVREKAKTLINRQGMTSTSMDANTTSLPV
jgi:hypothetical protein